jgi:ATP-binding cassette subfamily B protein
LLHALLSVLHALMPTAVLAVTTAAFVDTAGGILRGLRPRGDIYAPLALLLLGTGLFMTAGALTALAAARIRQRLAQKLRPRIVRTHAALDYRHIEDAAGLELVTRVARDPVTSVMDGFTGFMRLAQVAVCVLSILALIVASVWWAALVIALFSTPMFYLSLLAGKKNYQASRDAEKFKRRAEYLGEVLTGRAAADERTLFGYGRAVNARWFAQYEAWRLLRLRVTVKNFLITKGSSLMLALIALAVALTLVVPVTRGRMSAGMFIGIVSAVFGMIQQLGWQFSSSLEQISRVGEYMRDLTAFWALGEAPGALDPPDAEAPPFKTLEFRSVRFRYPTGGPYILDGLTFSLTRGRHYAFVGRNGAGKTTITKLLTGLYTEYEGEILVDGKELRTYPAGGLKALFSVVYQDFARYPVSMRDNIALGDVAGTGVGKDAGADASAGAHTGTGAGAGHPTQEAGGADEGDSGREAEAALLAGLGETVAGLRDGLMTPLGKAKEEGQELSGGQWQRLAIARSLISRAPVKILDEPTSALDPVSESRVYEEFEKLMAGRTTIFISHRLGSTKLADEILVIDGGRVAERGTHDELVASAGGYARMYESQREWYV